MTGSSINAADVAVLVTCLVNQAFNPVPGVSHSALHEKVSDLIELADQLKDTSLSDQKKLAIARSLLELEKLEPALQVLQGIFRKHVLWPPHRRRSHNSFFST
jgi:hypothetical protein